VSISKVRRLTFQSWNDININYYLCIIQGKTSDEILEMKYLLLNLSQNIFCFKMMKLTSKMVSKTSFGFPRMTKSLDPIFLRFESRSSRLSFRNRHRFGPTLAFSTNLKQKLQNNKIKNSFLKNPLIKTNKFYVNYALKTVSNKLHWRNLTNK
jgi:hypothetical protein